MKAEERKSIEAVDILVGQDDNGEVFSAEEALRPLRNRVTVKAGARELKDYLTHTLDDGGRRVPDLIILDRELLGDGCWGFIESLHQDFRLRRTVIAVMTDRRDKDVMDRAMEAGVDWFIPKPITLENLARLINDLDHIHLAVVRVKVEGEPIPS